MPAHGRRVLIVGGSFTGLLCARDLTHGFLVTVVDAKEFFEYTPGILRAYVKPKHFDALSFTLQPVIETKMQSKYIWGEVKTLDAVDRTAIIRPMFANEDEMIDFDYCMICSGCNFGPFAKWGESLWFPTIHAAARSESLWPQFDERFIEGRRRHILDEFNKVGQYNKNKNSILVVGAGFIGVEWITELEHFFKDLKLTIIDFLPNCLGPLPKKAADYCAAYMKRKGIKQFYNKKYDKDSEDFWGSIEFPNKTRPDKEYVCIGVKASNYFMPPETLSEKGPGGGGWILIDMKLSVKTREGKMWGADHKGQPRFFAVGDCNYSCVEGPPGSKPNTWPIPPWPKISYPGEEHAVIACCNLEKVDKISYQNRADDCCGKPVALNNMHWPWGAGMFATSLGPDDGCFVAGANWEKNSGFMVTWGSVCAVQKEIIEATITDEAQYGLVGRLIWHFVHHTPVHLFGGGPVWGYTW
jgi:hypothetical protein